MEGGQLDKKQLLKQSKEEYLKAISIGNNGVEVIETSEPKPKKQQVLVKVFASGLNRSDLLETQGQSFGHTGGGESKILGGEFAGEIIELGSEVKNLKIGDRVMCRGGSGWAEYAVSHCKRTIPINSELINWEQAATIQGNMQTMHDAIVTNAKFSSGHSVLIQGASSAVGLIGLQIAKALGASLVIGSSTNENRRAKLKTFGADLVIDTSDSNWLQELLDRTDGKGVDILIDMLSGDFLNLNMEATKINGHIINIGRLAGMNGNFDYDLHAKRRINYIGTTGRTRSIDENEKVANLANRDLWDLVLEGKIRHHIDQTFPLVEANKALEIMNKNKHFGKLVLLVN